MKPIAKAIKYSRFPVLVLLGIGIGVFIGMQFSTGTNNNKAESTESKQNRSPGEEKKEKPVTPKEKQATIWTCSMHPQVRQPKPGKCPLCGMTLIPLEKNSASEQSQNIPELKLSPRDEKLAEIKVYPVEKKLVEKQIRMVGMVAFDETKMGYITARMPGRIDRLFVNYTGIAVRKGDHMAEYYSPDLLVAQRELLLTAKDLKKPEQADSLVGYGLTRKRTYDSVIKKLKLWGLTDQNIQKILKSGKIADHVTLYAPIAGIVIHKNALEGEYFKTGDRLFTIVNLNDVWVNLEAYESDLEWLRYGQEVEFTTDAYPGETFKGQISFIDPILDKMTRTVRLRVVAANKDGRLKPEMFVHAIVKAKVAKGGKLMDTSLAGKWICPMHPQVIKDKPGTCDICGMNLVKAESLGYRSAEINRNEIPLVVPDTAVLVTGKRAVVYLREKPGVYVGRTITLGQRVGDYYIVKKGLSEGDEVVTNGNFKIDSALQIQAKPSMMSPKTDDSHDKTASSEPGIVTFQIPSGLLTQLNMIYDNYFKIQKALGKDNLADAVKYYRMLKKMLPHIDESALPADARSEWQKSKKEITAVIDTGLAANNINDIRASFSNLSAIIYQIAKQFGFSKKYRIYRFFCEMAFDNKGAYWLQDHKNALNPYFGNAMPKCGARTEEVKHE